MQKDMFTKVTVSDFLLDKDQLFARLTLSDAEYDLYQQIYHHVQPQAINTRPGDLFAGIAYHADRASEAAWNTFEKNISEYLWRLTESYTRFFHQYEDAPVMIINSENLNFVDSQEDFDLLLRQVDQMRGPRENFNRGI